MTLLTYPKFQAPDINGVNLSGGLVYFYESGNSTPKDTYSDIALSVTNSNPVVLNARGEADIYLDGKYKVILKTAADVEIWTEDPVTGTMLILTSPDWNVISNAATYVSTSTFTVTSATEFHSGRRLKLTGGADRYGTIFNVSGTTITVTSITDSSRTPQDLHSSMTRAYLGPAVDSTSQSVQFYRPLPGEAGVVSYEYLAAHVFRYMTAAQIADVKARTLLIDVTAAIQAALDVLTTGGECIASEGSYLTSSELVFNYDKITMRGEGDATIISNNAASGYAIDMGTAAFTESSLHLKDIQVICTGNADPIRIRGGNNVGTGLTRVHVTPKSSNTSAVGVTWSEAGQGAFDGLIDECDIDVWPGQTGIKIVNNSSAVTIRSTYIRGFNGYSDTTSTGIEVDGGSASVSIINSNIEGMAKNIVTGTSGNIRALYIAGNYFETYGNTGLDIDLSVNVLSAFIIGNFFKDSDSGGGDGAVNSIRLQDGSKNIVIMTNHFIDQTGTPILNQDTSGTANYLVTNNINDASGAIISALSGVRHLVDTDGGRDFIVNNANRGHVFGAASGNSTTILTAQESVDRNAGLAMQDTDGTLGGVIALARGANEILTGSANLDLIINTANNRSVMFGVNDTLVAEFDGSVTARDTRFLIYDVDNATVERVTVGSADSGGSGFKVLRIPN